MGLKSLLRRVHKSAVDPLDLMADKHSDPLGLLGRGNVAQSAVSAAPLLMPEPDSEAVAAARRRKLMQQKAKGGRESTLLVGESLSNLGRLGG